MKIKLLWSLAFLLMVGLYSTAQCTTPIIAPTAVESFETFTPTTSFTMENCWNEVSSGSFAWDLDGSGGTVSSGTGPSGANSGTNFFFTEASGSSFGDTAILESPLIDLSALTVPALIFQSHLRGDAIGSFDVLVSNNGGVTFSNVFNITGEQQMNDTDPWTLNIVDLSAFVGQTVIVRFSHTTADIMSLSIKSFFSWNNNNNGNC